MKIALCISGQPRSVEATYPFIEKNILEPNAPDIFIHSWIDDSIKGKRPVSAGGEIGSDAIPHDIDHIIHRLYAPKSVLFESQKYFDEKDYNDRKLMFIRPRHSLSQKYSVAQSFNLCRDYSVKNNILYDAIVRMRFDWGLQMPINAVDLPLEKITVPNDCPHRGGINDQFAVGNSANMGWYGELNDTLDTLYRTYQLPFCDEILLGKHLDVMHIELNRISIPYSIIRSSTPHERHDADFV